MKNSFFLGFLSIICVLVVILAFTSIHRYKKYTESIVKQNLMYIHKNNYLIRCLNYYSIIDKQKIRNLNENEYFVYYAGQSCSSCLESLLFILFDQYGLEENVSILVDDIGKKEFIANFNDGFKLNYKCFLELNSGLTSINEILLLRMDNGEISNILEFRPEEKHFFKEYFDYMVINSDN